MATTINWADIEDSDASQEELQSDVKSQAPSQSFSESQSSEQSSTKGKRVPHEVNHKYGSIQDYRESFKNQQLDALKKIQGKLVYLFIFKVHHSMFLTTIQQIKCVSKREQQRGWQLKINKTDAKKLITEGLANNMNAKIQLSKKNFYKKEQFKIPVPPKSETNTQDTKSIHQKQIRSATFTDNSDMSSKDFSERSSNVSQQKPQHTSTYGMREGGKDYSKVYYTKGSYNKPKNYEKPQYRLKQGSVYSQQMNQKNQKIDLLESGDEDQQLQIKKKKQKLEQQAKKKLQKRRRQKNERVKKEKINTKTQLSPKNATKTKSNNPFDAFD